jgi:hypothetical protein
VADIDNGVLFRHKEEFHSSSICKKMYGTEDHHFEQDKPSSKSKLPQLFC